MKFLDMKKQVNADAFILALLMRTGNGAEVDKVYRTVIVSRQLKTGEAVAMKNRAIEMCEAMDRYEDGAHPSNLPVDPREWSFYRDRDNRLHAAV